MSKTPGNFSTPNSSRVAEMLLQLKDVADSQTSVLNGIEMFPPAEMNVEEGEDRSASNGAAAGDTCNCRKSKCLKLYCQCFAAKSLCTSLCRCVACENYSESSAVREEAIKSILERNPNAFDSKFKSSAASVVMTSNGVAHRNGCRCRKSQCLKKYCECFQAAIACSNICTCLTCCNTVYPPVISSGLAEDHIRPVNPEKSRKVTFDPVNPAVDAVESGPSEQQSFASLYSKMVKPAAEKGAKTTRPPLFPANNKRKRVDDVPEQTPASVVANLIAANNTALLTPNSSLTVDGVTVEEQRNVLLDKLLNQEISPEAKDLLLSLCRMNAGPETASSSSSTGATMQHIRKEAISIRSASPNSISIASALALLAANNLNPYNGNPPPLPSIPSGLGGAAGITAENTSPNSNAFVTPHGSLSGKGTYIAKDVEDVAGIYVNDKMGTPRIPQHQHQEVVRQIHENEGYVMSATKAPNSTNDGDYLSQGSKSKSPQETMDTSMTSDETDEEAYSAELYRSRQNSIDTMSLHANLNNTAVNI